MRERAREGRGTKRPGPALRGSPRLRASLGPARASTGVRPRRDAAACPAAVPAFSLRFAPIGGPQRPLPGSRAGARQSSRRAGAARPTSAHLRVLPCPCRATLHTLLPPLRRRPRPLTPTSGTPPSPRNIPIPPQVPPLRGERHDHAPVHAHPPLPRGHPRPFFPHASPSPVSHQGPRATSLLVAQQDQGTVGPPGNASCMRIVSHIQAHQPLPPPIVTKVPLALLDGRRELFSRHLNVNPFSAAPDAAPLSQPAGTSLVRLEMRLACAWFLTSRHTNTTTPLPLPTCRRSKPWGSTSTTRWSSPTGRWVAGWTPTRTRRPHSVTLTLTLIQTSTVTPQLKSLPMGDTLPNLV